MAYEAHVAQYKKDVVSKITDLLLSSKVIGVVNMENLPAPQLANIRMQLRKDGTTILMSKRRLMEHALKNAEGKRKDITNIKKHLGGMPAFIFTDKDPFKIARMMKKSRSPAPAKAGQTAPRDLIIPAGPTPFSPGPIISELAAVGLKTGVENGKVTIRQDAVIVEAGEKINQKQADMLAKFGIQPMEVGIDLVAIYDSGLIYGKDVLDIEPEQYLKNVVLASQSAIGLAMGIGYYTKETSELLIAKAFREAKSVALSQGIFADLLAKDLVAMADRQAQGLQSTVNV